jgi:hypothetical protein
MSDQDIIRGAYQQNVTAVYNTFVASFNAAEDDQQRTQAEQLFQRGIRRAREIRDRALAILP